MFMLTCTVMHIRLSAIQDRGKGICLEGGVDAITRSTNLQDLRYIYVTSVSIGDPSPCENESQYGGVLRTYVGVDGVINISGGNGRPVHK